MRRLALRERRQAIRDAQNAICSRRYTRLVLQFQRWLLALDAEHPELFDAPVKPFARRALTKTRSDFLLDCRPLSRMSEEDRHSLRKRGKQARYATEFFSRLWEGPTVDNYLKLLEAVQDRLGSANDAVVARLLAAGVSPRRLDRSSLLLVRDWSLARETTCLAAGQPVWRRMQRATPFWN